MTEYPSSQTWQIRETARALRAARKAAGFKSGSAAAQSCGFPDAKYRSHEAGSRTINQKDIERYARAFNVSIDVLRVSGHPQVHAIEREALFQDGVSKEKAVQARRVAGWRLQTARLARGYDSGTRAAKANILPAPTYLGHESGKSSFSAASSRLYAAIFGVRESWLRNGELPSGLGLDFDTQLQAKGEGIDVRSLRGLIAPYRTPKPSALAALRQAVRADEAPKWTTAGGGDMLPEIEFSDLRKLGLDALGSLRAASWPLPKGFVRSAFNARIKELIVAVCDRPCGPFRPGDRLFVNTAKTALSELGQFLAIRNGDLVCLDIREEPPAASADTLIGQILATFAFSR